MNQDQNNWNMNTQYNNPIPNNQTINNSLNQNIQEPIQVQNNVFTNNNGENNNNSSKKTKLFLIIGIVFILLLIIVLLVFGLSNKKEDNNPNTDNEQENIEKPNNSQNSISGTISKMHVSFDHIIALSTNDKLYGVGKFYGLGEDKDEFSEPTLIANNVKDFISGQALYYLDNNNDLYRAGLNYNFGVIKEFEKHYENVKQFDTYMGLCLSLTTKDNKYYFTNGKTKDFCGSKEALKELNQYAEDVKFGFSAYHFNGYVNNDNELYISTDVNEEYKKAMDDVIDYSASLSFVRVLTANNEVYEVSVDMTTKEVTKELLGSDVKELEFDYVKKEDNKYYAYIDVDNRIVDSRLNNSEITKTSGYYKFNMDDIKDIYYYTPSITKMVYLNNDNKIVLGFIGKEDIKIDNKIENIKKILEFMKG